MSKRLLGKVLRAIGTPSVFGMTSFFHSIAYDEKFSNLIWAAPLTVATLPLLPLFILGDKLSQQLDVKDFLKRTKDLPREHLPIDYLYLVQDDKEWKIEPLHMDGEEEAFPSEADARYFLYTLNYREVLSKDTDRLMTFWVKNNE